MSVTLMRNKNGKQVPIKLSIWDAFKGVPVPKPRVHQCISCGKLHKPACKVDSAQDDKAAKGNKSKESLAQSKTAEKKSDSGFTAAEDAKIKEMKTEDPSCPWNKVAEALDSKHSKDACKHRYKELQEAEKGGEGKENQGDNESKKGNGKDKKNGKKDNSSNDTASGRPMTKKERKAANRDAKEVEAEASKLEKAPAATEAAKPVEEVQYSPASADYKQKWIAAAAKHFDRTGQRITPEQARKLAEEAT